MGSQVDLPAMPKISHNLLPLLFYWVFSSSPPFKLACGFMDYPEALPPHFPSTSHSLSLRSASPPRASPSLLPPNKLGFA